jgi:hypothetical protein
MRSFKITFLILLLTVFCAFAATNYDETVSKLDLPGKVVYYGSVTFADSASGDIYYTQAFLYGPYNSGIFFGYFVCSEAGTEDVNVFIEYSNDRTTWYIGATNSALDAVGTTAKADTLNLINGVTDFPYKTFVWARMKFVVGQNMNSTTLTWSVGLDKPDGGYNKKDAAVKNRGT